MCTWDIQHFPSFLCDTTGIWNWPRIIPFSAIVRDSFERMTPVTRCFFSSRLFVELSQLPPNPQRGRASLPGSKRQKIYPLSLTGNQSKLAWESWRVGFSSALCQDSRILIGTSSCSHQRGSPHGYFIGKNKNWSMFSNPQKLFLLSTILLLLLQGLIKSGFV